MKIIATGIILLLLTVTIGLFVDVISPETLTENRLEFTEKRIQEYAAQNHKLPASLSDLPTSPPERDYKVVDGWGAPFVYIAQPDGSFVLKSIGMDSENSGCTMQLPIVDIHNERVLENNAIFWNLWDIADELRRYAATHHHLPNDLGDMQGVDLNGGLAIPGDPDGWWGPLSYVLQSDGTVTISRYGKWGHDKVFSLRFTISGLNPTGPTTAVTEPVL